MNMRKNILVTPLVAMLAVGASGIYASAQDLTSAVISGTVTGPDNKPLSGVRVYLTSPTLLTPRDGRTDANGQFSFRLLPPGKYTVTYSMDGFISRKAEMSLLAGIVANGSIKLKATDVQGETIEIVAETTNMITPDKTDTAVQTAFTSERLEEIGGGRGVAALQALTPGINGSLLNPNGFNIRGSLARGNKIMQDGQLVGDTLLGTLFDNGSTIEDLIESIAIIQSPLNAKLGNTDGGIVSITTKRGGNMFSGSLRYSGKRESGWGAKRVNYPDARGFAAGESGPGNDVFSRSWQYSLTGPIIPNYLTFTLGGNITPTTYTQRRYLDTSINWAWDAWQTRWPSSYSFLARTGTFYLDNDTTSPYYGNVVRASDWGDMGGPDAAAYYYTKSGNNNFSLYAQITPNHQFNYYYMQGDSFVNISGEDNMGDIDPLYGTQTFVRAWNLSYKAVLGASGVLDMRYGRAMNYRDRPKSGRESIQVQTWATYWDFDAGVRPSMLGSMVNANSMNQDYFDNYLANGVIDSFWARYNTYLNWNRAPNYFNTYGVNAAGSDGSGNTSINANYQHLLEYRGQHIIDVGFNIQDADAPGIPSGARWYASPTGQIARNLQSSQIGLMDMQSFGLPPGPNGYNYQRAPVARYAGKYIVFDVRSRISDIEPHVLTRENYQGNMLKDGPIWDMSSGTYGRLNPDIPNFSWDYLPYMTERWGSDVGDMINVMTSGYVNDHWTINEKHSVMLGFRLDNFNLKDSERTVHSYTKITPRLEYKYDMLGDQRHLFAASYGQFHQMANMNLYWPFIKTKWGNTNRLLWSGDAVDQSKKARGYYLVDKEDILNPANYFLAAEPTLSGAMFGDVDKGFKPPTSTEYSAWYRHTFPNGGYVKVSFNNRTWADLYDYFPSEVFEWENPNTHAKSKRIKATLRNTDEFTRTYNGLELQWDFPITKKVAFGGNYTYSSYKHNQTGIGSSSRYIGGNSAQSVALQTPWWFDEVFSRNVEVNGNVVWSGNGRATWSPMQKQDAEFAIGYYLIVNLTQGKARSNFTLRGRYTGPSFEYEGANVMTGTAVMPGVVNYPMDEHTQLNNYMLVPFGSYTRGESFYNSLAYNLNMPLAKGLSWFINISVDNVFNHIPRNNQVPSGSATDRIRFWNIQYGVNAQGAPQYYNNNWASAAINPWRDGWTYPSNNVATAFTARDQQLRSIQMSTGIRF